MNKSNPRILLLVALTAAIMSAGFYYSVFTKIISWKNPFLKDKSVSQKTTIRTTTPVNSSKITPTAYYSPEDVQITEIKTDKDEYGSKETIIFTIIINSKVDIKRAQIKINGIKPSNTSYINESEIRYIYKGDNEIFIKSISPSCTGGCGGVNPGTYTITAEIYTDNNIISVAETTLNLINL